MYIRTDFCNLASHVTAGNVRKGNVDTRQTVTNPQVEVIQSAGMNADQDFIVTEMWLRNLRVVQHAGVAMLMKNDSLHERPPRFERAQKNSWQTYRNTICWRSLPRRPHTNVTPAMGECPDG